MLKATTKFVFIFYIFIFSLPVFLHAQISTRKPDFRTIPKGIKYEGEIKEATQWTDSLGNHLVITNETGVYKSEKFKHESDGIDAELLAYHFLITGDSVKQAWRVYDYISDCPVDIEASFIKGTLLVTDLNNNHVAEIWLMYKMVCHGDVSPGDMKIIMYEGQQKFAMRGQNKVFEGTDEKGKKQYSGGAYKFDEVFVRGPKVFQEFAKKMWKKHIMG